MSSNRKDFFTKTDPSQAIRCPWASAGVAGYGEHLFPLLAFCQTLSVSVGRHLADAAVWIAITSFLATFSIHKALDEHAKEIPVAPKFYVGISWFVEPLLFLLNNISDVLSAVPRHFPVELSLESTTHQRKG